VEKLKAGQEHSRESGSNTMSLYSFQGASGRHYDYALLNQKIRAAFPMSGGNYVFARQSGIELEIICAGETDSIWNIFVSTALWETAKKTYGATAAYLHLNADRKAREMERSDLVSKYLPPMNLEFQEDDES
jgi:hypothetical protein